MARVWQHSRHRAGTLLVLLAIADYADEAGVAYPSVQTLMDKSRLSERSVQAALRRLEAAGELLTDAQAGPHRCNLYQVRIAPDEGAETAPRRNCTPQKTTQEGAENDTLRVQPAAPKPSLTRHKNRQQQHARARARDGGGGGGDLSISEETAEEQCPLAPHTYTGSYGDHLATDERHRVKTGRGRARGEGGFQQLGSLLPNDVRERLARRPIHVDD